MSDIFDLPPALPGSRHRFDGPHGRVSYYRSAPDAAPAEPPLILVHSVNAAASAYEMRPLYEHYRTGRDVIAIDLPGYGFSDRPDTLYTPRLMTDTLHALLDDALDASGNNGPVDAIALSLSCEFLARAASERPQRLRTVGFISPTGFSGDKPRDGEPGETRGLPWLYRSLNASSRVGRALFNGLTSRPSVRYFLRKTWGRKEIDEGAFEYAYQTAHQPGARHAPFCFLSGYLFSADISRVYQGLTHPVWMSHGSRGDFTDYRHKTAFGDKPNWHINAYDTGALPHFEILDRLTADYDRFLSRAVQLPQEPVA